MQRILVLGDPHFRKDNLSIFIKVCSEILSLIDRENPDLCICLGDTLDTHERIHLRAQTMAINFFKDIAKKCPLVIIIGNHDRENNSDFMSEIHPFVGLESHPEITIVSKTTEGSLGPFNFIYVPYVYPGRFREALAAVGFYPESDTAIKSDSLKNPPHLIFCHQEFRGCNMGSVISSNGDPWGESLPLVIAGHIHDYQVLPRVIYVGTFMQQTYGESSDKALCLLTLKETSLQKSTDEQGPIITGPDSHPCFVTLTRINLLSCPIKKTIHLKYPDITFITKENNTLVKVVVHVDSTEVKSMRGSPQFKVLGELADKIEIKIEGGKINLASQIVKRDEGVLDLPSLVKDLLKDDKETLELLEKEVLN